MTSIQAEEEKSPPIDLATCLENRTQQYPLKMYSRVYIVSPFRTGSTLVYNVLRILFEKEGSPNLVHKTHYLGHLNNNRFKKRYLYVFTLRNPVDSCFSWYRVKYGNQMVDRELIKKDIKDQITKWQMLNRLLKLKKKVIVLKYEDFVDDMGTIFNALEKTLSISINEMDKDFIGKALSKDNVLEYIKDIDSFDKWNNIDHLHGNHLDQNEISDDLKYEIKMIIREELLGYHALFIQWGYSVL